MAKTMNDLEKILKNSGNDMDATDASIFQIITQIRRLQDRARKHISDNYEDFMPNLTSPDMYINEIAMLLPQAERLLEDTRKNVDNAMLEANELLSKCIDELQEISLALRLSQRILIIDDNFRCVEKAYATKDYLIVLDFLEKLEALIYSVDKSEIDALFIKCKCYNSIKVKYHIQAHILKENLQQRFERLVEITEKKIPTAKCITIKVSKDVNQLNDISMALFQTQYDPIKLCDFLLNSCFLPIILKPVSLELTDKNSEHTQLTLSYSLKDLDNSLRPSYKQVFENIKALFMCLNNINVSVCENNHVFTIIGTNIKKDLLKTLVNECLINSIPDTLHDFKESTLLLDVIEFEHWLADIFFIDTKYDKDLSEFVEKFEIYFRNRFSLKTYKSVKDIMHKDLQDMILIAEKNTKEKVMQTPYIFPRCMISKSTLELITILDHMKHKWETDENDDGFYLNVICNILNTYVIQLPSIHEQLLESIPQQSALLYNNFMFLADWIATNAKRGVGILPTLTKTLQATATKHLNSQIEHQEQIVMCILRELDFSDVETLSEAHLKLIRQCLRQLDLLKNVWQNVLPENKYNEIFTELLNNFCNEIIKRILKIEDIPENVAKGMSELITIVLEKVPLLFKDKHEVIHIKSWMRLQQLRTILNAPLKEIVELWCNGAGILTANFRADEIKYLIRALFQNTDRRANALVQIV